MGEYDDVVGASYTLLTVDDPLRNVSSNFLPWCFLCAGDPFGSNPFRDLTLDIP